MKLIPLMAVQLCITVTRFAQTKPIAFIKNDGRAVTNHDNAYLVHTLTDPAPSSNLYSFTDVRTNGQLIRKGKLLKAKRILPDEELSEYNLQYLSCMKSAFVLLLLLMGLCANAQVRQNVYFIAKDGRMVKQKDSAEMVRVIREPDSGSHYYNVLEYYAKSGHKRMIGRSSAIEPVKLEGTCITYYDNGHQRSVSQYLHNLNRGREFFFFPNGKPYTVKEFGEPDTTREYDDHTPQAARIISSFDSTGKAQVVNGNGYYKGYEGDNFKQVFEEGNIKDGLKDGEWKGTAEKGNVSFTETYDNGQLISGHAKDNDGEYTYKKRLQLPQYTGGMTEFYKYLSRNINYPVWERTKNIQGLVILYFVVTRDHQIKKIKVMQSVSPDIDAEAIRVLRQSKGWQPGAAFGRQVEYSYTVPIRFSLFNQ